MPDGCGLLSSTNRMFLTQPDGKEIGVLHRPTHVPNVVGTRKARARVRPCRDLSELINWASELGCRCQQVGSVTRNQQPATSARGLLSGAFHHLMFCAIDLTPGSAASIVTARNVTIEIAGEDTIGGSHSLYQSPKASLPSFIAVPRYEQSATQPMLFVPLFTNVPRWASRTLLDTRSYLGPSTRVVIFYIYCILLLALLPSHASGGVLFGGDKEDDIPHVNGYLKLTFDPPDVTLVQDEVSKGTINISLTSGALVANLPDTVWVRPCCPDPQIATLLETAPRSVSLTQNVSSLVSITVKGNTLGRTSIKFLIMKNSSMTPASSYGVRSELDLHNKRPSSAFLLSRQPSRTGKIPQDILAWASNNSESAWWLPFVYEITVTNRADPACFYLSAVVLGLMALNMIAIGGQVDGNEVIYLLKQPMAVGIGLLCRFGIIPAVSTIVVLLACMKSSLFLLCVCLSVFLSVCLSVCLSLSLSLCLPLSFCLSPLSVNLAAISVSVCLCLCLSHPLSVNMSATSISVRGSVSPVRMGPGIEHCTAPHAYCKMYVRCIYNAYDV